MIDFALTKRLHTTDGEMDLAVEMHIADGEFVFLFGRSGAGKTTILRMLAGLTEPDDGYIRVGDQCWYDRAKGINLAPQRRRAGLVFQDYALFPNMTVRGNLEFALQDRHDAKRIDDILTVTDLTQLAGRHPDTLSGGQKQRVALARAIVAGPSILLLDEPLSALEWEMRTRLQEEIVKVHHQYRLTTVMVSHDVAEIFKLADQVIVLDKGSIVKRGTAAEVFGSGRVEGEITFAAEVLDITRGDPGAALSLLLGNDIVKVAVSRDTAAALSAGDRVWVSTQAINPTVRRMEST
jgi:molybdate transport system ATP-binding protein